MLSSFELKRTNSQPYSYNQGQLLTSKYSFTYTKMTNLLKKFNCQEKEKMTEKND